MNRTKGELILVARVIYGASIEITACSFTTKNKRSAEKIILSSATEILPDRTQIIAKCIFSTLKKLR